VLGLVIASLVGLGNPPSAPPVTQKPEALDWFVKHPTATQLTVAILAGVVTAAAPWVGRTWRRWAWVVVLGVVFGRMMVTPVDLASLRALLAGWLGGALAVVISGPRPAAPAGCRSRAGWPRSGCR
jgi:hypothetical protein